MGKICWAQVAASRDMTSHHLAAFHSRAAFEEHVMVPGRPATIDGYAIYDTLDITQRCWTHILRDAEAEARAVTKASMETVDIHKNAAAAQHLDIPQDVAAHCQVHSGEFVLSLNAYEPTGIIYLSYTV